MERPQAIAHRRDCRDAREWLQTLVSTLRSRSAAELQATRTSLACVCGPSVPRGGPPLSAPPLTLRYPPCPSHGDAEHVQHPGGRCRARKARIQRTCAMETDATFAEHARRRSELAEEEEAAAAAMKSTGVYPLCAVCRKACDALHAKIPCGHVVCSLERCNGEQCAYCDTPTTETVRMSVTEVGACPQPMLAPPSPPLQPLRRQPIATLPLSHSPGEGRGRREAAMSMRDSGKLCNGGL